MNLKGFSQFVAEESQKEITFTFGRFQPPTVGHEKLINETARLAVGGTYRIYLSQSEDPKKNPLSLESKLKWMRKMFPRHARNIVADDDVNNVLQILVKLYDQNFTRVTLVVGQDRVTEFETLVTKYNGVQMRDGFYNFESGPHVRSAGERDPDSDGVTGMSASKMRAAASANDFELFAKGLPQKFAEKQELFNDVRNGMGLKESHNFRKHIQLASTGDRREAYVSGDIFKVGDPVVLKESDEVGQIEVCGSNYLIVKMPDGRKLRKWLDKVDPVEKDLTEEIIPPMVIQSTPIQVRQPSKARIPLSKIRTFRKS